MKNIVYLITLPFRLCAIALWALFAPVLLFAGAFLGYRGVTDMWKMVVGVGGYIFKDE